tara:strand:- start:2726 stop:3658 length:933 start_codon:yes stop_codon:yes gene_type:complete
MKKLQAVRAGAGSDITSSYKPEKKLTEGEGGSCGPEEQSGEAGDITFNAGGAIPTTIKSIGDPRELETAMRLKKTQLRAMGLNMSHEPEGEMVEAKIDDKLRKDAKPIKGGGLYKSGMNKKVMGDRAVEARRNANAAPKTGMYTDKFKAQAERQKVHQAKRGVKKNMGEELGNVANINVKPENYISEKDLINDILKKNSNLNELNRFEKEKGTDTKTGKPVTKGGTAKDDKAFQFVAKKYGNQRMGANQPKKVKGAKSDEGTGRITKMVAKKKEQQARSKALDAKAKKSGYKSTQDYVNVQAVRKGGLGT